MHKLDAHRAKRILVAQAVATLVVSLVGLVFGPLEGLFALIGGATALVANALFAYWVFGPYSAAEPGKLVGRFIGGEVMKLGLVALVFVTTFISMNSISPLALFGAFLTVQVLPPLLANRIAG
jgi:ATP synthase protein I